MNCIGDDLNASVAQAYDARSGEYSRFALDAFASARGERSILRLFADLLQSEKSSGASQTARFGASYRPLVLDAGCGPGHLTHHLESLGVRAQGIDLSSDLVEHARRLYSGLDFQVCSMQRTSYPENFFDGLLAWYSIIHSTKREVAEAARECARILRPGGLLLVAFFESDTSEVLAFDHAITSAFRWPGESLFRVFQEEGFTLEAYIRRTPSAEERFMRGHLLLRLR